MHTAISRALPLLAAAIGSALLAGCGAAPVGSRPASVAPLTARDPAGGGDSVPDVDVSVEALLGHVAPAVLERRNPFRFGSTGADGWSSGANGSASGPRGRDETDGTDGTAPAGAATTTTAAPQALEPLDGLRLIGFVETRDSLERVAVLTDGDRVSYGLVNDVVNGRYRVLAVSGTSVEIEDVARGTRKILRLPES